MKVVQVIPRLDGGGVERGTLEIAKALVEAGHEAKVISAGGRMVPALEDSGAEHITMDLGKKSPATLRAIRPLRDWLRSEQVDVLHPRSRLPAWVCLLALRNSVGIRTRLATSVHGLHSVNTYSAVVTRGELIEAVSETAKQYLLQNYPRVEESRVRLIYRGIDKATHFPEFAPSAKWFAAWYEEIRNGERPLLTLPGRLSRLKGHEYLFDIVRSLARNNTSVYALIVGGPEPGREKYVQELTGEVESDPVLADSVRFLGHRTDLREIMCVSDIVLSLSNKPEAFGRTVLEALSLGTKVVGFDHGGVGEMLGRLFPVGAVPVGDTESAARVISSLLVGRPTIGDHEWTLERMCQSTIEMYEELV